MTEFLLTYRRSRGELIECLEFAQRSDATRARTAREREFIADPDVEVVVLTAASREQIMRTHSRYFRTVQELASDMSLALDR